MNNSPENFGEKNYFQIKRVLTITLALNWLVAIAKISIGLFSGSLSILTDGFHSLFDGLSNILGLIGTRIAAKPKSTKYPYGHGKYESLAALGISVLISVVGYEFAKNAIGKLFNLTAPDITLLTFLVMTGAFAADLFVYFYENYWGKKLKSAILIADSLHTKAHLFITPSVILGMIAVRAGFPIADPLLALFVVIMLGKMAWEITRETAVTLCDQAFVDEEKIQKIARQVKGVASSHHIRSRGDNRHVFLDMHIILDPALSLRESHNISYQLKEKIMKELPQIKDVVIHPEPTGEECRCQ